MSDPAMVAEIQTKIADLTQGRPYVFVVMPFRKKFELFREIQRLAQDEVHLACIRADDLELPGIPLLTKLHQMIDGAYLVVADITEMGANVFYETGYSIGVKKPVLMLLEKGHDLPIDLRGMEVIEYDTGTRHGHQAFVDTLGASLRKRIHSRTAILREMLVAPAPFPAYIVAHPKAPVGPNSGRIRGQVFDERTFSDYVGVVGLIRSFAQLFGEASQIELVNSGYLANGFATRADQPKNLYLIGSKKVNPCSGEMLEAVQQGCRPHWYFGSMAEPEDSNYIVRMYRQRGDRDSEIDGKNAEVMVDGEKAIIHVEDYGLIVRAPHPVYSKRIVLILAGAHSLGSAAACMAATRTSILNQIRDRLEKEGIALADTAKPFWALVKGVANEKDHLLDESGVTVMEVGGYQR